MRTEWTILNMGNVEFKILLLRKTDSLYYIPKFYHNSVCDWYDVYGMHFLKTTYYVLISHINK